MPTSKPTTVFLDLAKKMREMGWQQKGTHLFLWDMNSKITQSKTDFPKHNHDWLLHAVAAPTGEEILDALPIIEPRCDGTARLCASPLEGKRWRIAYIQTTLGSHIHFDEDSLANAAAAMWCYLKDNKLI